MTRTTNHATLGKLLSSMQTPGVAEGEEGNEPRKEMRMTDNGWVVLGNLGVLAFTAFLCWLFHSGWLVLFPLVYHFKQTEKGKP